MNYPVWEIPSLGGGTLIAIVSILHVYISHLAVGGGLFLWLTDWKGVRENNPEIKQYVKKHTWFFLLLTMVFGGITGVGIWFTIALVHPAATSLLIHNFVFGWAIEWVFFVGEIAALLLYYYRFEFLSSKNRLLLAFYYFLFAWLSLFVINGILSFMLTPGQWLATHKFWHGFFNPTFFPSLIFRTFITIMIAGLFGYVTTVHLPDSSFRTTMMRYCSKWLLFPIIGLVLFGSWYYYALPAQVRVVNFYLNPQVFPFIKIIIVSTVLIFLIGIYLSLKSNRLLQQIVTFVLVITGLFWMGGFEYIREIARKPFVINNVMYSNSILLDDASRLAQQRFLTQTKWAANAEIAPDNQIQAGKELFMIQCMNCHSVGGFRNDIKLQTSRYTYKGLIAFLNGLGKVHAYMPPFFGNEQEKEALATYLTSLHGKPIYEEIEPSDIQHLNVDLPAFDMNNDQYVLLAWSTLGMKYLTDCDQWFSMFPPGNTLRAKLIQRAETPVIIEDDVEISYEIEAGFENPSERVPFWDYANSNYKLKIEKNFGFTSNRLSGNFIYDNQAGCFVAENLPVIPYKTDGIYNPYPVFTIVAKNPVTKEVLARTQVVSPVSTELGCRNCHEGKWKVNNIAGISDETAINILKSHDRLSKTSLYQQALKGNPQSCTSCHKDDPDSTTKQLNLSASIHGFHANYITDKGTKACSICHPAYITGGTRLYRGIHAIMNLECTSCHGQLDDHALSLLIGYKNNENAQRLIANLQTKNFKDYIPRHPWLNVPACLSCHEGFEQAGANATSFNKWSKPQERYQDATDDIGIQCPACHNAPHALYPSQNPFNLKLDNIQPLQYSGLPYPIGSNFSCEICHTIEMESSVHHDNMERMFRNTNLFQEGF